MTFAASTYKVILKDLLLESVRISGEKLNISNLLNLIFMRVIQVIWDKVHYIRGKRLHRFTSCVPRQLLSHSQYHHEVHHPCHCCHRSCLRLWLQGCHMWRMSGRCWRSCHPSSGRGESGWTDCHPQARCLSSGMFVPFDQSN